MSTQGAMSRGGLRDELHAQVLATIREGGQLLAGGEPVAGVGAFYQPTVLDRVTPEMTAAREETFGPVAAIIRVPDAREAIRVANDSPFGLGAALWCGDVAAAHALSRQIAAVAVLINGLVGTDRRLPYICKGSCRESVGQEG